MMDFGKQVVAGLVAGLLILGLAGCVLACADCWRYCSDTYPRRTR
jgi:hypothetical protein